jgi:hypothetical protein
MNKANLIMKKFTAQFSTASVISRKAQQTIKGGISSVYCYFSCQNSAGEELATGGTLGQCNTRCAGTGGRCIRECIDL